jgi:uncharacterized protein (TIGR02186 family)
MLLAAPARAEDVVVGLSQDRVAITTSFDGSQILIFGAVRREAPAPLGPLAVIVTVAGPPERVTVRRKERRFGIWVNADAVEVDAAPSFYAVASSAPLSEALSRTEDQRHRITPVRAIRAVDTRSAEAQSFVQALIRVRTREGAYGLGGNRVDLAEDTLFSTEIDLPANLTEGNYQVRIFLTRGGTVVDRQEAAIFVSKVGLERWIWTLAHERPLIYGLLSLAIAILAGWGASAAFTLLRR